MSAPLNATRIPTVGIQLIEASAGTGKTYTITSLYLRLIGELGFELEQIAAVTFTNAATEELKERVQLRLARAVSLLQAGDASSGDEMVAHLLALPDRQLVLRRLQVALRVVDRVAIFTIHGFSARMLAQYALESGVRSEVDLLPDDRAILYDVVTDFWSSEVASLPVEQLAELGAFSQQSSYLAASRVLSGASEVPLAGEPPEPALRETLARFAELFRGARTVWLEQGEGLRKLLREESAIKRNLYRLPTIDKTAESFTRFFEAESPRARAYPDLEKGYWTNSKLQSSLKKGTSIAPHPLLDLLEELREAALEVEVSASELAACLRARLAKQIEARLLAEHDLGRTESFDGLLLGLCRALRDPERGAALARAIRTRFPAIMIDEFQDTDRIQYEIFRRVFGQPGERAVLYLIGDPKQSIYRFRGADVQTYLGAAREASESVWTLGTSYRSSPRLVQALNLTFGNSGRPFASEDIAYALVQVAPHAQDQLSWEGNQESPPALRIAVCEGQNLLEQAAREVDRLLSAGLLLAGRALSPGSIAVLTRTNLEASQVQELLRALGIPAVMHGDRSVFEAPEALELRRVLRALAEPSSRALFRAALATRFLGLASHELFLMKEDAQLLETWTGRLRTHGELWRTRGVAHALEGLSSVVELLPRSLAELDGERRMTNFRHLLELLHEAEKREHLGVVGLLRWLDTAIASPTGHAMAPESRQVRLESDEDAVTLTTAHKSKGLEYDVVVLPSIGKKESPRKAGSVVRFHDPKADGEERLELRAQSPETEENILQSQREELEESFRVGYVALTRARHLVVCLYDLPAPLSPLGWLLHERRLPSNVSEALLGRSKVPLEEARADLVELHARAAGVVELEFVSDAPLRPPGVHSPRSATGALPLVPPPAFPTLPQPVLTSSFSAMTRESTTLSRHARVGYDFDEVELLAVPEPSQKGALERILLADFPRGAGPGNALHAIFEHLPHAGGTPEERRVVVSERLAEFGYAEGQTEVVTEAVERVLHLPLAAEGTRLIDLGRDDVAREMEFNLTVGEDGSSARSARSLSGKGLMRALSHHPPDYLSADYLRHVGELGFGAFRGYLRGFIDLVFVAGGKFYVLDYKSNYLGEHYSDYEASSMQHAMEEHHYLLQGLLYSVAVARYAKTRLASYTHERHFGGVIYLFLRGVREQKDSGAQVSSEPSALAAELPANAGVYRFMPSEAQLAALSEGLQGRWE